MKTVARLLLALFALTLTSAGLLAAATPAQAVDFYRYWSFFEVQGGGYTYAKKGVAATTPAAGSIQAFRYAASAESTPNLPRIDLSQATFDVVCGDAQAAAGDKLVAVLVDFGLESDAEGQAVPQAEAACADVPEDATTLQVLDKVGEVRSKSSSLGPLLCAIDGYPVKGCADQTTSTPTPADTGFVPVELAGASSSASSSASSTASGSATAEPSDLPQGTGQDNDQATEQGRGAQAWPYVVVVVVFFGLVAAALYFVRKRRSGA